MGKRSHHILELFKYYAVSLLLLMTFADSYGQSASEPRNLIKRLESLKQKGDAEGVLNTMYQVGLHYLASHEPSQAIQYFEQTAELSLETDNNIMLGKCYSHLGEIYAQYEGADHNDKALATLHKALQIQKIAKDTIGEIRSLTTKGKVLFGLNLFTEAALSFEEGKIKAHSIGADKETTDIYLQLSKTYDELGDQRRASQYHHLYMGTELSQKAKQPMPALSNIAELEEKDIAIQKLELEKNKKAIRIADLLKSEHDAKARLQQVEAEFHKKQAVQLTQKVVLERWLRWSMTALIIVSCLLMFLLVRSNFKKTKANQYLGEQKRNIERDSLKLRKENNLIASKQDTLRNTKTQLERQLREMKILNDAQTTLIASTQASFSEKLSEIIDFLHQAREGQHTLTSDDIVKLEKLLNEVKGLDFFPTDVKVGQLG